jgi:prolyl oligopeptidase
LDIENEVDRYIAWPGQALAYKIGQLKILELREKSEKALGDDFDIKDFHHEVLKRGSLPLSMLEAYINQWIEDSLGS